MGTQITETNVVRWVQYDNKIKEYNEKIKLLRNERESLSNGIFDELMIPKSVSNKQLPQFTIGAMNTRVLCQKQRNYESITYKFLTECLREYFQNDEHTPEQSEEKAKDVLLYIRQKRGYEDKFILKQNTLK